MPGKHIALALVIGCAACSSRTDDSNGGTPASAPLADAARDVAPSLPTSFGPELAGLGGEYLSDVESCGACHPDAFEQQQSSAHALASFNNPVYRMSVERLRDERGREASLMCAGCHDAALMADGAMSEAVEAADPRAHNGVSCRLCHGIESADRDGNGSFVLKSRELAIPVDGDAASLERHKEAVRPPPIAELCGSCHQSFLSTESGNALVLVGQLEMLSWANSAYAGQGTARIDSVEQADCIDCHMPKVAAPLGDAAANDKGEISSHRVLGGHTWLAAMRGDDKQLARLESFLKTAATVDVMGQSMEDGELSLDVVIRNVGVGHRFPAGVRDAANTVIRVRAYAGDGTLLLQSAEGDDSHVLRSYVANEEGQLLLRRETHDFAAPIADHTIAPRDATVVRYRGKLPANVTVDRIEAELLHRSRSDELQIASCEEMKSERGRRFAEHASRLGAGTADACIDQPGIVIAKVARGIGERGEDDFQRSYEHGMGLLHEMQERAEAARPSLERALELATSNRQRAMVFVALAKLASRVGRVDDALALFSRAEEVAPGSAAVAAGRGDAFAKVWRWESAANEYATAVKLAPGNASLWTRYALALGSSGQRLQAFDAAQRGLVLSPRNPDLLRVQALAMREQGALGAEEAMDTYLAHRGSDNRGAIIKRCSDRSELCAREALPVHEHVLHAPAKKAKPRP